MVWTLSRSNLVLVVCGFTLITGLPTNILSFYTFFKKIRQQSTPIDVLLLSLNISDLIFLFVLPFHMLEAANMKWTLPYFLCPLYGFIFYSTIHNSTLHLMAISVDRYLGVTFPIKYKLNRNPRNAVIASIVFWVVSMAHCSIVYIMQYHNHFNPNVTDPSKRNTCYEDFSDEQLKILLPVRLELFTVLFCVPFLISCFCYIKCICILSNLPNVNSKKRIRAIGMALATLLVFTICFMPFNISHVVGFVGGYSPEWREHALLVSTLNASLDPFIFYFSSSALREIFNNILSKLVMRLTLLCSSTALYCPPLSCEKTEEKSQCSDDWSH
ncbi:free fatty acid receptor 2-like [Myxocyprinus asiaticus]|uniref:free fatty acid receptor 2-like n=1 Tax=Myxocyprinus asiaticus TaxID=70543 RepID=UPI0022225D05|nr:free fatty acid receptor 2-like [Myxocyprinus asiaticus]XP_051575390.1 free fatty acid receptor 2-like [Myxocyprinus asiaticus]